MPSYLRPELYLQTKNASKWAGYTESSRGAAAMEKRKLAKIVMVKCE